MRKFLDRKGLRERGISYSNPQLWRLEQAGTFPRRVPLSTHRCAWIEDEIQEWIETRIAQRDRRRPAA